ATAAVPARTPRRLIRCLDCMIASLNRGKTRLALLWQILSGAGFPNQFFSDSWVVGLWRGRPWEAANQIGRRSLDAPPVSRRPFRSACDGAHIPVARPRRITWH